MSAQSTHSPSDNELEWIELRQDLDIIAEKQKDVKWYKENNLIKGGVLFTTCAFLYGLLNMHHPLKSTYGAYARIFGQACVGSVFCWGFLKYSSQKNPKKIDLNYHD